MRERHLLFREEFEAFFVGPAGCSRIGGGGVGGGGAGVMFELSSLPDFPGNSGTSERCFILFCALYKNVIETPRAMIDASDTYSVRLW